jgi:hypothetical protein
MSHPQVSITAWPSHLWVLFSKKLNRLHTPRTMHGSQNDTLKWALQSRGDAGYCDGAAPSGLLIYPPSYANNHLTSFSFTCFRVLPSLIVC